MPRSHVPGLDDHRRHPAVAYDRDHAAVDVDVLRLQTQVIAEAVRELADNEGVGVWTRPLDSAGRLGFRSGVGKVRMWLAKWF